MPHTVQTDRGIFPKGTPLKILSVDSFKGLAFETPLGALIFEKEIKDSTHPESGSFLSKLSFNEGDQH